MFDFDIGSDGASGPFINWHAQGRQDGTAEPKTFSLRDGDDRNDITAAFKKGVIFDIDAMKTGWALFSATGTEWRWNETVGRMASKPGDDWKNGVSIPVALGKGVVGTWSQAGSGTWLAIKELAKELKDRPDEGKLPKVKMTGVETVKFTVGSTTMPKLVVEKWIDRPDSFDAKAEAEAESEPETTASFDDDEF
jgi:hypothetical protein